MAEPPAILKLSNELLRDVLDHIEAAPEKLVNLDHRSYLSQESFRPPPPPSRNQLQDISSFRLACRRFSELGAVHQFARVTTRFSRKGLRRLENIASQLHLAKHVKKFSYMVPYFYVEGRERIREVLGGFDESLGSLDVSNFERKLKEQKDIVSSEEDARVLRKALVAFVSLQHVQILRVQDWEDGILMGHLRENLELMEHVELRWAPACSHSTKTIGAAILASQSPCSRFSSPMLSPQSAQFLAAHTPTKFGLLASRLTSLELHFDDGNELDAKMMELSGLFRTVFLAAKHMQAIHIGFPSHRPLSLRLEDIFHNVTWRNLIAFGIQAWRLEVEEIIGLVGRHKDRLRGLRLRDVYLRDGSMWKDVLGFLRDDCPRLDWVSLRRIGYEKHFDEQWAAAGVEVPDDPPGGLSDSDMDSEERSLGYDSDLESRPDSDRSPRQTDLNSYSDDDDSDDDTDDSEDGLGRDAHDIDFPQLSPDTPSSAPWCNCSGRPSGRPDTAEDLGDNGQFVSNAQRRLWEKWVVRRCPEHSWASEAQQT